MSLLVDPSTTSAGASSPDSLPYRILVVDDMATNRALVRAVLPEPGYAVVEAENGGQALALLSASSPACCSTSSPITCPCIASIND